MAKKQPATKIKTAGKNVMKQYSKGKLKSGKSNKTVKDISQARAIMFSAQRAADKKAKGKKHSHA